MQTRTNASLWLTSISLLILSLASACASISGGQTAPMPTITLAAVHVPADSSPAARTPTPRPTVIPLSGMFVHERVLPTPYLAPTIVRAPVAWKRSTGAGVTVAVTRNDAEDLSLLNLIAPDAQVEPLQVSPDLMVGNQRLVDLLWEKHIQILAIPAPSDFDARLLSTMIAVAAREGTATFVVGDLSATDWRSIDQLEMNGAITVGRLNPGGKAQGDDVANRTLNLFAPDGTRQGRGALLTAAGVGALVLAAAPNLTPAALKEQLVSTADEMYQASYLSTGQWNPSALQVDPRTGDYSPNDKAFRFRRVNAARAVGVTLGERWPVNALNAPVAWKRATGRGVKVAVIDQGFHVDNPLFELHLVDQASFFPGQDFNRIQNFHGTAMAKIVLSIAPDASLVFLHTGESNQFETMAKAYAQAIDYAIAHQVKVITSSAAPWPNTPEVHAAIDRAITAGITFVWFHYNGPNNAVIRPGFYYDPRWEVGAFDRFFDDDKPSDLEAGLSMTSPQIAAIAALVLQNEPQLSPAQVKQRIIETATVLPSGNSIADAAAAVENRPSGRHPAHSPTDAPADGHVSVVYQAPGSAEKISVEIQELGQNWPIPVWPHRDILFYPIAYSASALNNVSFAFQAYRDRSVFVAAASQPSPVDPNVSLERIALYPRANEPYTVVLDGKTAPPLQVRVEGERVSLTWEQPGGVPLDRMDQTGRTSPSGYRLFRLEAETQALPSLSLASY